MQRKEEVQHWKEGRKYSTGRKEGRKYITGRKKVHHWKEGRRKYNTGRKYIAGPYFATLKGLVATLP